jgi:general stress protein YciG
MAKSKLPAGALEFFREQGRKGGKLSGAARMAKLTPERRSEIAKKAVAAREAKRAAGARSARKASL